MAALRWVPPDGDLFEEIHTLKNNLLLAPPKFLRTTHRITILLDLATRRLCRVNRPTHRSWRLRTILAPVDYVSSHHPLILRDGHAPVRGFKGIARPSWRTLLLSAPTHPSVWRSYFHLPDPPSDIYDATPPLHVALFAPTPDSKSRSDFHAIYLLRAILAADISCLRHWTPQLLRAAVLVSDPSVVDIIAYKFSTTPQDAALAGRHAMNMLAAIEGSSGSQRNCRSASCRPQRPSSHLLSAENRLYRLLIILCGSKTSHGGLTRELPFYADLIRLSGQALQVVPAQRTEYVRKEQQKIAESYGLSETRAIHSLIGPPVKFVATTAEKVAVLRSAVRVSVWEYEGG